MALFYLFCTCVLVVKLLCCHQSSSLQNVKANRLRNISSLQHKLTDVQECQTERLFIKYSKRQ